MSTFDSWTPLFSSIVRSSVWGLQPHVKIVWITMIALKDRNGMVESSVSGLARLAVVSVDECREALEIFKSPDEDSKDKTNDGRKIVEVDGGWVILGHERFQAKMQDVSIKLGNAKRQAKFRAKKIGEPKSKIPKSHDKPPSPDYMAKERRALKAEENGDREAFERAVDGNEI